MDEQYSRMNEDQFMEALCDKLAQLPRRKQREAEKAIYLYLGRPEIRQQSQPRGHAHLDVGDGSS